MTGLQTLREASRKAGALSLTREETVLIHTHRAVAGGPYAAAVGPYAAGIVVPDAAWYRIRDKSRESHIVASTPIGTS